MTHLIVNFPWFIPALFILVGGTFIFKRLKYGSWTGVFLSGSILRTVGEVTLRSSMATTRIIRVLAMENSDKSEQFVGLTLIFKAPLSASMAPFKMTRQQALDLSEYLKAAAK